MDIETSGKGNGTGEIGELYIKFWQRFIDITKASLKDPKYKPPDDVSFNLPRLTYFLHPAKLGFSLRRSF